MQKTRDQSLQARIIISHARFEPRMVENAKHPDCSQHALEHTSHYGTVQPIYWEHFQQTSANTPTSPHTSALQWIKQELWSSASDYFLKLVRIGALSSRMTFNRGTVYLYYTSIFIEAREKMHAMGLHVWISEVWISQTLTMLCFGSKPSCAKDPTDFGHPSKLKCG